MYFPVLLANETIATPPPFPTGSVAIITASIEEDKEDSHSISGLSQADARVRHLTPAPSSTPEPLLIAKPGAEVKEKDGRRLDHTTVGSGDTNVIKEDSNLSHHCKCVCVCV